MGVGEQLLWRLGEVPGELSASIDTPRPLPEFTLVLAMVSIWEDCMTD